LQPTKLTASSADAPRSPKVRASEYFVIVVRTPARPKEFRRAAVYPDEMPGVALGLCVDNNLQANGMEEHAKGEAVGVKFLACTMASPKRKPMT
jgi:hypothetical protein